MFDLVGNQNCWFSHAKAHLCVCFLDDAVRKFLSPTLNLTFVCVCVLCVFLTNAHAELGFQCDLF